MTAPQKPWENGRAQFHQRQNVINGIASGLLASPAGRNVLNSYAPQLTNTMGSMRPATSPPLPPRPPQLCMPVPSRSTFGMAPSLYGGYSGGYSGYGGYPSYGSYPGSMYLQGGGYGFGSYGQPGNAFDNRFLQAAEDSSRSAFQSIESLVHTFTSVSMMLESTYHAMYSSFRAVLGVVDNFSRLRQMFAQFLSAITILRIIQNFYRRLLYWLGVMDHSPESDQAWAAAAAAVGPSTQVSSYSPWPLFTFIGLLFGGPYLISKFFSSTVEKSRKWDNKDGTFFQAAYPHQAASHTELGFNVNELLNVAPPALQLKDNNGWVLAVNQEGKVGYVPNTYLRKCIPRPNDNVTAEPVPSKVEPSVQTKDEN